MIGAPIAHGSTAWAGQYLWTRPHGTPAALALRANISYDHAMADRARGHQGRDP